jgi:hypothetical protein
MVVNFRVCGISLGTRKMVWTPTLIKKKFIVLKEICKLD